MLNFRKPAIWLSSLALIVCAVAAACLLTDPAKSAAEPSPAVTISSKELCFDEMNYHNMYASGLDIYAADAQLAVELYGSDIHHKAF